jgi:isopentenyl-diphosphate delta-isomerase type 1
MGATEYVVLVDETDTEIGTAEKMQAHRQGLLHRAFSVFIFSPDRRELLLQQRASHKYHSGGLWSNACCSHPHPHEDILIAGKRRLYEELGIVTDLEDLGSFQYMAHFSNGLSENEIDHVLVGTVFDPHIINPNPNEVQATRWITPADLRRALTDHPEHFTPWLARALELIKVQ